MIKTAKASEVRSVAKKLVEPLTAEIKADMIEIRAELAEVMRAHNRAMEAFKNTNTKEKELTVLQGKVDKDNALLHEEFRDLKQSVTQGMTKVGSLIARVVNLEGETAKLRKRQDRIAEVQAQKENRGE